MYFKPLYFCFATISVAIGLSACEPSVGMPERGSAGECDASAYNSLLWKPKSVLDGQDFPKGTRVIGPDSMVTMDFRPDRLNITYGKLGRIERVYCG